MTRWCLQLARPLPSPIVPSFPIRHGQLWSASARTRRRRYRSILIKARPEQLLIRARCLPGLSSSALTSKFKGYLKCLPLYPHGRSHPRNLQQFLMRNRLLMQPLRLGLSSLDPAKMCSACDLLCELRVSTPKRAPSQKRPRKYPSQLEDFARARRRQLCIKPPLTATRR